MHTQEKQRAVRKYFVSGDLRLSYLDFGGESEKVLVTLHGHMGNARMFAALAGRLTGWSVISLDQRGHGWSDHAKDRNYRRESYVQDVLALIESELGGQAVTLLGHSLGGLNAYQFAARYPELVKAVIVEDIGVEKFPHMVLPETFPERCGSLKELGDTLVSVGLKSLDYFLESAFEDERGWGLRFDFQDIISSGGSQHGIWWEDWLAGTQPILLIHGRKSWALDLEQAKKMVARRANTQLEVFEESGHSIHDDDPDGFYRVVSTFLNEIA